MKKGKYLFLMAALCPLVPLPLYSQEEEEEFEELEEFVAEETIDDPLGIIPTREIDSVFGVDKNIVDIPRSVTIVEGSTLDSYGIDSVGDIAAVSAGTFSNNQFGIEGNVDIRNTNGDNYFRGFKKLTNRGNFRTPIGAADRFEIIKGPPPVFYGVGSVGGLLNYYPKTARGANAQYFEEDTGKISATYGTYDKKKFSIEYGTPFEIAGRKGGLYTYLGVEDSGNFYNFVDNRDRIFQITTVYDLTDKITMEMGIQYGDFDQIQNPGWNRLTQSLIDNGTYITGVASVRARDVDGSGRLEPDELDGGTGFGQFSNVIPGISANFIGTGGGITVGGVDLDTFIANNLVDTTDIDGDGNTTETLAGLDDLGTTTLSPRVGYTEGEDFGISRNFTGYFDLHFDAGDNLTLKNQLFYDYYDTQRNTTYGFNNDYEGHVIEDKFTGVWNPDFGELPVEMNVIFGGSVRYTEVIARSDFLTEPFTIRDLTQTVTADDRIALAQVSFESSQGGFSRATNSYDNFVENHYTDTGLFLNFDTTVWDALNINAGVTQHWINVSAQNRGFLNRAAPSTVFGDSDNYLNGSFSVSYTTPWNIVPYFTIAKSSFIDDGQASELDVGQVTSNSYVQDSDLVEAGLKGVVFDNKLYFAFSVYQQNRTQFSAQLGTSVGERTTGYELELNYAMNKNFFFTGTASWLKTQRKGTQTILGVPLTFIADQQGISVEEAYSRYGALRFNSFGGTINNAFTVNPEEPGRPDKIISVYGNYISDYGLACTIGFTYFPSVNAGYFGDVVLPEYFEWNGSISYAFNKNWSARINISNIFDETGYKSQNLFFDELALPIAGRRADLTVSYAW